MASKPSNRRDLYVVAVKRKKPPPGPVARPVNPGPVRPKPDIWRGVPVLGAAVPEGGFPQPLPDGPRRPRFTYPKGPTRPTPGSAKGRRRNRWD